MSTKSSLKHHQDEDGSWFHLYRDCFDEENEFVYLELAGVPFETASSIGLSGQGVPRVAVRIPDAWARKLGLIEGSVPERAADGEKKRRAREAAHRLGEMGGTMPDLPPVPRRRSPKGGKL